MLWPWGAKIEKHRNVVMQSHASDKSSPLWRLSNRSTAKRRNAKVVGSLKNSVVA